MSDEKTTAEPSGADGGSTSGAFAEYKRLARICGVDEGIDLPVVAMAFIHGAAYGARHPKLTDEERVALAHFSYMGGGVCQLTTTHAATVRSLLGRVK